MPNDTIVVMGNGPSLKDVDFDMLNGVDTFGLNSAYRAYERMDWWPTYHGCFDYRVTECHREQFINLIDNSPIEKCFYIINISDNTDNFQHVNMQQYGTTQKWNNQVQDYAHFHDNGNSGANASSAAICMGYKKIILLGVDCNYVEFVDGSKRDGPGGLIMEKTPDTNPNYWFDDYQQAGDKYNVPDGLKFHMPTWNTFGYRAAHAGVEVINCSPITTLRCFKRMTIEEALKC
tara:strand:- start:1272 stop:1970 length:699 start_codon:yes stop_codon:yes gene_type:complete